MRDKKEFYEILGEIDGQPLSAMKQLIGDFDFSRYVLKIDAFHSDFAETGVPFIVRVPAVIAEFPPELFSSPLSCTLLEDFLTRKMLEQFDELVRFEDDGTAYRRLEIAEPEDIVLPRSSMVVTEEYIEARIKFRLPGDQDALNAASLKDIFFMELPEAVSRSLLFFNLDEQELGRFVNDMEDMDEIRQILPTQGFVAFVPDGAILEKRDADITVRCDAGILTEITTPHDVTVGGVGIKSGITVILGEEYAGRRALMQSLAEGIYNRSAAHRGPAVVTVPDAVYVVAEPGRSIQKVDLNLFTAASVGGDNFSTDDATSYESQAAAVIENLEIGAHVLLFDEADSSPAFLAGDSRVRGLTGQRESALPLSACARQIVDELGVSIVVAGANTMTEYLPIADTVLKIENGAIADITQQAKALNIPAFEAEIDSRKLHDVIEKSRCLVPASIDPSMGVEDAVIRALDVDLLEFGRSWIDLSALRQLADVYQTNTIGLIIYYARLRYMNESRSIREILDLVDRDLSTEGLECLSGMLRGDLARPRRYEIAGALNRLSTLRIARREE